MKKSVFIVILLFIIQPKSLLGEDREYMLKASFIGKFTQFIEWPDSKEMDDTTSPFSITLIGKNPYKNLLELMYGDKKIKKKNVRFKFITTEKDLGTPHVLILGELVETSLENVLESTAGSPVLIIGEKSGYAQKGVHINFYITHKGTIHFEINEKKLKDSGLSTSLILLEIAKLVN